MAFKNGVAALFLLTTLWAVLATSSPQSSLESGSFYIISDCVNPVRESAITVSANQISSPLSTTFIDFGFPQATVRLGNEVRGTIGAIERVCSPTYGDTRDEADDWIFSCYDSGAAKCTILIKEQ